MKQMPFEDVAELREQEDLRIIDVREQDEYDEVHVKGVELFPLSKIREGETPEPDDRKTAIICRSGGRSEMAARALEKKGFDELINVSDGTQGAIEAGEEHIER